MKGLKKITAIILCAVMMLTAMPLGAFAAEEREVVDSGFCGAHGENLTWTFYDNGELVISGEGDMDWYSIKYGKLPPWFEYRFDIWNITVEHGVTSIGTYAFYFAEVMLRNNPTLHWGYITKPKNDINAKCPVLKGFSYNQTLNPVRIVTVLSLRSKDEKEINRLYEVYHVWVDSVKIGAFSL